MSAIVFSPAIGPVPIDVVLSESHLSEIEITGNPIETGAEVDDHAYVKPKEVILDIADGNAAATYAAIVRFQESRVPFVLVTGLMVYSNMLVQSVSAFRDTDTNHILSGSATIREIKIASTSGSSGATDTSSTAAPGGAGAQRAAPPAVASVAPSVADRAAAPVIRGDSRVTTTPASSNQLIISRALA